MYIPASEIGACEPLGNNTLDNHIKLVLGSRAVNRLNEAVSSWLVASGFRNVVLGGGALRKGTPKDLDFFPPFKNPDKDLYLCNLKTILKRERLPDDSAYYEKTTAGGVVQVCRHEAGSLLELVEDFDFAHCQYARVTRVVKGDASADVEVEIDEGDKTGVDVYLLASSIKHGDVWFFAAGGKVLSKQVEDGHELIKRVKIEEVALTVRGVSSEYAVKLSPLPQPEKEES